MSVKLVSDIVDVTVSIMSYKRPHYLAEAIKSVLLQTKRPVKILVFDNGSGDDVRHVVTAFEDDGVVWQGAEMPGTAFWNFRRALDAADSKYVYVMHDDDRLCSDFLEKQVAVLESNADATAVACNGYIIDSVGARTGEMIGPKVFDANGILGSSSKVALLYAQDSWLTFASVVYRVNYVKQLPIREEFGKVADAVFLCDLADKGPIIYQIMPLYEYRIHCGQDSSSFPLPVLQKLEEFLFTRLGANVALNALLESTVRRLSTRRIIGAIQRSLGDREAFFSFVHGISLISFKYFSTFEALIYILLFLKKRLSSFVRGQQS